MTKWLGSYVGNNLREVESVLHPWKPVCRLASGNELATTRVWKPAMYPATRLSCGRYVIYTRMNASTSCFSCLYEMCYQIWTSLSVNYQLLSDDPLVATVSFVLRLLWSRFILLTKESSSSFYYYYYYYCCCCCCCCYYSTKRPRSWTYLRINDCLLWNKQGPRTLCEQNVQFLVVNTDPRCSSCCVLESVAFRQYSNHRERERERESYVLIRFE
jgi:hypothetical protein